MNTTEGGNKYILTIIYLFTRWAEAIPLRDQKADTIAHAFLDHWICRHRTPHRILTDQGRNFDGKLFASVCDLLRTDKVAFKPSKNGLCVRISGTLKRYLKALALPDPLNWDRLLHLPMLAYRTTPHRATGITPQFLLYAREIKLPCDMIYWHPAPEQRVESYAVRMLNEMPSVFARARVSLVEYQRRMKARYDLVAVKKHRRSTTGESTTEGNDTRRIQIVSSRVDRPLQIIKVQ